MLSPRRRSEVYSNNNVGKGATAARRDCVTSKGRLRMNACRKKQLLKRRCAWGSRVPGENIRSRILNGVVFEASPPATPLPQTTACVLSSIIVSNGEPTKRGGTFPCNGKEERTEEGGRKEGGGGGRKLSEITGDEGMKKHTQRKEREGGRAGRSGAASSADFVPLAGGYEAEHRCTSKPLCPLSVVQTATCDANIRVCLGVDDNTNRVRYVSVPRGEGGN